jgi:TPR repeat protein
MQENGEGVEKDFTRAVTLFRRACDGADMPGCTDLGEMYVKALGVEKDTALGMSLYHKACDGGSQDACTRLKSPQ